MSCCKYKTGDLRHRLALQSNTPDTSVMGQDVANYSTYATVWGSLRPMRGKELINAQQISAEVTSKAVIRYLSTVKSTDRILFETRTFEVFDIIDFDEMHVFMELTLKEIKQ